MKNISTDSLRTFVMVVEVGGFAKAGDLLGLSQPAVSLQIKRLEDLLGYKLFKKQGQRQVLNQYGELLLPMAKQMMQYNAHKIFDKTLISAFWRQLKGN